VFAKRVHLAPEDECGVGDGGDAEDGRELSSDADSLRCFHLTPAVQALQFPYSLIQNIAA
jgi:hypothetical protein